MKIVVNLMSGGSVVLEATPSSLVYDLKEQLRAMQPEPMQVELLQKEKKLQSGTSLETLFEDSKESKEKEKRGLKRELELMALFLPEDAVQVPGDVAAEAFKGSTICVAEVLGKSIGREAFQGQRVLSFTQSHRKHVKSIQSDLQVYLKDVKVESNDIENTLKIH